MSEEVIQDQIINGSFQDPNISFTPPDIQTFEPTFESTNSTEIENQNSDFPNPQMIQPQTFYNATLVNQSEDVAPVQINNQYNNMRITRNDEVDSGVNYLSPLTAIDDDRNRTFCSKCWWFFTNCWCDFESTIFSATSGINQGIIKSTSEFQRWRENCLYNTCCSPK